MTSSEAVLRRLEKAIIPQNLIDPFEKPKGFRWLSERLFYGSYSPMASRERSFQFETSAKIPAIKRIGKVRKNWLDKIDKDPPAAEKEKDKKLFELGNRWNKLKKGGKEEQTWVEEAIGITAAFFEKYQKAKNPDFLKLHDNQLYYCMLMCLGQGKFRDQLEIRLKKHGVNLDTGEGKTISTAIITAVRVIRGEAIHIIEQNYLSAISHAREIAPFHNQFLHKDVSIITDVSGFEKKEKQEKKTGLKVMPDGRIVDPKKEKKFTVLPNGQIVEQDQFEKLPDYQVRKDGIIVNAPKHNPTENDSFVWRDGIEKKISDWKGRADCWLSPIVYCDFNSLGGDIAKDRIVRLQPQERFGPPDISKATAIVQEADALMFDWASTHFIIEDNPKKGFLAWMDYAQIFGFKDGVRSFKKAAYFSWDVWRLVTQIGPALEEKFYKTPEGIIEIDQETLDAVQSIIEENFKGDKELHNILKKNHQIVESAVMIYLGYKPREKYIPDKEPVLLDRYNLPLDRRELTGLYNLFLQMSNFYDQKGFFENPPSDNDFDQLIDETFFSIKSSSNTLSRVLPITIFNEYGDLVFTSGSLIPLASYFADIYGAEVLGVNRHEPLKEEATPPNNRLYTKTLDGGMSEVNLIDKGLQPRLIYEIVNEIVSKGQAGLIIMPDIESAYQLNQALTEFFERENIPEPVEKDDKRQIIVITGQEEHKQKGLLNKIAADLKPGDIIITTQIAHRDVDPRPSKELIDNGGYEVIVCDPPNERGMWQALQRTVRFNKPGKRRLIITDQEIKRVANKMLLPISPSSPFDLPDKERLKKVHQERLAQFEALWQQALEGNLESQKNLFFQYLDYLRLGESRIAEQLRSLYINDWRLQEWQKSFIRKITSRKNWQTETEVLATYELGLLKTLAFLKNKPYETMSNHERKIVEKLILRQHQIQERLIKYLWSEFLTTIDKKYSLFRLAPYYPFFSAGQPINRDNIEMLKSAWDEIVRKSIKKYYLGHLFSALTGNIARESN